MANSCYSHVHNIGLEDKIMHVGWCPNYHWMYVTGNFGDTLGFMLHVLLQLIHKTLPH